MNGDAGESEPYENLGFELNNDEKRFFVDKGYCRVTKDDKGQKQPIFISLEHRQSCIDRYLAFYAKFIGSEDEKRNTPDKQERSFLHLEFDTDRDIYLSIIDFSKYKGALSWKQASDFSLDVKDISESELGIRSVIREAAIAFSNIKSPYTGVIVRVKTPFRIQAFTINSFEMFIEVKLPWVISGKDGKGLVINLSGNQMDSYLANPSMMDFYTTEDGIVELQIIDPDSKQKIISTIINNTVKRLNIDKDNGKVLILTFKNGDSDLFSALAGTIKYDYSKEVDISTLKEQVYYKEIEKLTKPLVVIVNVPRTEKILYYAVGSRD